MRIGLALPHYDFSIPGVNPITFEAVAEAAVRAERLGFDSVWVSDHFFSTMERYGGGPERYGSLDPLVTLAALAPLTERMRLGTLVLSAGFRHPAIVGKSATAIDRLSNGRLELGMGAGWFEAEYEGFGYEFGRTSPRCSAPNPRRSRAGASRSETRTTIRARSRSQGHR
jgi:alkanesulfonate monooxygenase SsuD/methylene tetrahydromethanopterin reductase-like flavin-dependent oxidoreductase (luciferase family)